MKWSKILDMLLLLFLLTTYEKVLRVCLPVCRKCAQNFGVYIETSPQTAQYEL